MFSSAEQLSAVHRQEHTQRLNQIIKREYQLRAQQLARQSPNLTTEQQNDLLKKGIFQDPFIGSLGSALLLTPSRLNLVNPSPKTVPTSLITDKQQVNGGLMLNKNKSSNEQNDKTSTPSSQSGKHIHQPVHSFSVAVQAATAAQYLRNSTLRKQLAKRNLEQKQNKLKDANFSSSFDQTKDQSINKTALTRFLKKSNVIRPIQLQHSLSLTSFAGVPSNSNQIGNQFNNRLNNQLKLTKPSDELKQPIKCTGIDKNIMTINRQPITLDLLYNGNSNGKSQLKTNQPTTTQFNCFDRDLELNKLNQDRLYSKSVQNIEQPITWLDQEMISIEDDELPLPAPLPLDILTNKRKRTNQNLSSIDFPKSRSMPMLINQSDALFSPYYNEQHQDDVDIDLGEDEMNDNFNTFNHTIHYRNTFPSSSNYDSFGLNSSVDHLNTQTISNFDNHSNTQDDTFNCYHQDHQQRRYLNTMTNNQHMDAQLQQFLSAFNHYTQQQTSTNRNQTRSLFDLY